MDRDIDSTEDARVEAFVAAVEGLADMLKSLQPGFVPADRMSGLMGVLAREARSLHAQRSLTPRPFTGRHAND